MSSALASELVLALGLRRGVILFNNKIITGIIPMGLPYIPCSLLLITLYTVLLYWQHIYALYDYFR
jgi:hypothetical protein